MADNAVRFLATGSDETDLALTTRFEAAVTIAPRTGIFLFDKSLPFIRRKPVPFGKSFEFVMRAFSPRAVDIIPGQEFMGQKFGYAKGSISPDYPIMHGVRIPRDQMLQSDFEVLQDQAAENVGAIEREYDFRMCVLAARGARAPSVTKDGLTVHNGGNVVTRSGSSSSADTAFTNAYPYSVAGAKNARDDLRSLGNLMDLDNIPADNRWVLARTEFYNALLYEGFNPIVYGTPSNQAVASGGSQVFSSDYQMGNSVMQRRIIELDGFKIMERRANRSSGGGPMPNELISTGLSKFQGDFTPQATTGVPAAIAFAPASNGQGAIGVAEYEGIQSAVLWQPQSLSYLVISWMYLATDYMHPYLLGSVEVTS